jgi:hypothetical protein
MRLAERYEIVDCLYDGRTVVVYRPRARQGGVSVVLKMLKPGAGSALKEAQASTGRAPRRAAERARR